MPRKAPQKENIFEHRITFGNKERELIEKTANKVALSNTAGAIGSAVSGLGVAGVAIAALIWVGFNIDDFIDNTSTRIVTWLEKNGWVVYWAPVYGMKLKEAEDELAAIWEEMQTLNLDTTAGENRYAVLQVRWAILVKRIKVLTLIIGKIADGTFKSSGYSWANDGGDYAEGRMEHWYDYYWREQYPDDPEDDVIEEGDAAAYAASAE